MISDILTDTNTKMERANEALRRDLSTIRTGRATPILLDRVKVDYHGTPSPIKHIANISVPEARSLLIQPWDKSTLNSIEKAILKANLGLNPSNDGSVIRLMVPPLTDEQRREIVKMVRRRCEEAKVTLRNIRREAMESIRMLEKEKEISQDDQKRALAQLQQFTDNSTEAINSIGQDKEAEVMEI